MNAISLFLVPTRTPISCNSSEYTHKLAANIISSCRFPTSACAPDAKSFVSSRISNALLEFSSRIYSKLMIFNAVTALLAALCFLLMSRSQSTSGSFGRSRSHLLVWQHRTN
ncbi:hypothetical protein P692DRAFT_20582585 [Suillus brevipes Sb2]|nr:hypothetical protein P692DRAFT_20582585 [Suillus brevipes Sb2]